MTTLQKDSVFSELCSKCGGEGEKKVGIPELTRYLLSWKRRKAENATPFVVTSMVFWKKNCQEQQMRKGVLNMVGEDRGVWMKGCGGRVGKRWETEEDISRKTR